MMDQNVVHLTYDMRIGGTETVIKNIVTGLTHYNSIRSEVQPRIESSILCIESPLGPFGEQLRQSGTQITNLNWQGGFDRSLIRQIRQHLITNNVDIIHCHQYTPWTYGVFAALGTKTKVIFTEHGRFYPDSSSWKRRFINPLLLAFTNSVTAISKATKLALEQFEFIPTGKTEVIYNGIEQLQVAAQDIESIRKQHDIKESDFVYGTVARLDPIKNQELMLRAFHKTLVKFPNNKLFIVGDGEEREKLESIVKELKLTDNVIFTGYISEPKAYIALVDVFLLSSLSEGTSMTLLEAMSLSKPCIVTDAGGNPEIIMENVNGLVTTNDDVESFFDAMDRIQEDNSLIPQMQEQACKRFYDLFDRNKMVNEYINLYKKLAK